MAHDHQHRERFKAGVRASVTWLHERALAMVDPVCQAHLNSAATNLGWDLAADRVREGRDPIPHAPEGAVEVLVTTAVDFERRIHGFPWSKRDNGLTAPSIVDAKGSVVAHTAERMTFDNRVSHLRADMIVAAVNALATPPGDEVAELRAKAEQWRWLAHGNATAADAHAARATAAEAEAAELRTMLADANETVSLLARQKEAAEAQRDALQAENARLLQFVDYVLLWRDRGPPHGDPVTAWGAVSGHPVVGQRARAALTQHQQGNGGEGHGG